MPLLNGVKPPADCGNVRPGAKLILRDHCTRDATYVTGAFRAEPPGTVGCAALR